MYDPGTRMEVLENATFAVMCFIICLPILWFLAASPQLLGCTACFAVGIALSMLYCECETDLGSP
jgi:hypothetical protein